MSAIEQIGAGLAGGALGIGLDSINNNRMKKNTRTFMDWQKADSKEMTEFNMKKQLELWKKTGYTGQMEELKKAGLNPALIYGQGGSGGSTGLSQGSGGSISGSGESSRSIDIANNLSIGKMNEAQLKLIEAQTKNIEAEAQNKIMDNATKERFGQEADMLEAQNRTSKALTDGYYKFNDKEGLEKVRNSNIGQSKYFKELDNDFTINNVERLIKENGLNDELEQIALKTLNMALDAKEKEEKIELTKEQTRKVWHDIWQGWTNAGFNGLGKIINGAFLKGFGDKVEKTTRPINTIKGVPVK